MLKIQTGENMKFSIVLCVAVALTAVRANDIEETNETRPQQQQQDADEVFREEYCNEQNSPPSRDQCSSFRCTKDNGKVIGIACAEARCSGKPVAFRGDPSKPYPDCCMVPICEIGD